MSVEVICEKMFSKVDEEIIDKLVEFHHVLIEANIVELKAILLDDFELVNMFAGNLSKSDFISMVEDEGLDFSKSDIIDPTILWDDENRASLIADIRLTVKINGSERRWISKSVVGFEKVDGKWCISKWDN